MRKSILFATIALVSFFLALVSFPQISLGAALGLSVLKLHYAGIAVSVVLFATYFAVLGVAAMTELKKPFVYLGIVLASLLPLAIRSFSVQTGIVSLGILASSALYYKRTHSAAKNLVHFSPHAASEVALSFSLTLLLISMTLSVFLSAGDLTMDVLVPDDVIDLSIGMLESQVESLGCSMSQTISECAQIQAESQITAQAEQLKLQCEPLRSNPTAYSTCLSQVNQQLEQTASSVSAEIANELARQFGADTSDAVIADVARTTIRNEVLRTLRPYENYVPFLVAVAALTLLGVFNAIIKFLVPVLAVIVSRAMIYLKFLKVEKAKVEVEILK